MSFGLETYHVAQLCLILCVVNAYQFLKGQFMVNFTAKNFLICLFLLISSIRIPSSFS